MPRPPATGRVVLDEATWLRLREAHRARVEVWTSPFLARRRAGVAHPVEDFLFTYYSHRPAALSRWHPGLGIDLEVGPSTGAEYAARRDYVVVAGLARVDPGLLERRRKLVEALRTLLAATASRPPRLGCFGLHEWAMVHGRPADTVRHPAWPLRLGADGTDAVVETHRVACSHFDAFRFFTPSARPLNTLTPGPEDRAEFEQPGCLHAGMDLYKHAYRLSPLVGSELVADCFALARDIRTLDMRASPYDLTGLGYAPVRIETPAGKQEYVAAQRAFADRAAPLRASLIQECERLLGGG